MLRVSLNKAQRQQSDRVIWKKPVFKALLTELSSTMKIPLNEHGKKSVKVPGPAGEAPRKIQAPDNFSTILAPKEWKTLFPSQTHVFKCKSCKNLAGIEEVERHVCSYDVLEVSSIEFRQALDDTFRCGQCNKYIVKSCLAFHAGFHQEKKQENHKRRSGPVAESVKDFIVVPLDISEGPPLKRARQDNEAQ